MPRILALLVSLLTAATLFADTADLEVGISNPPGPTPVGPVALGGRIALPFFVRNNGPNTAHDVRVVITLPPGMSGAGAFSPGNVCDGLTCTLSFMGAGQTADINFHANVPRQPGRIVIYLAASAAIEDPQPYNNAVAVAFDVVAQPDLVLDYFNFLPDANPGSKSILNVALGNNGAPATNVVVTVELPEGATFVERVGAEGAFHCELNGRTATCRAATFAGGSIYDPPPIRLRFLNSSDAAGGYTSAAISVTSDEADLDPHNNTANAQWRVRRLFAVTSADDSGPGSLRQAILDANADCPLRCVVGFRLPGPLPEAGFFTIRPATPLPPATFYGPIDGTTQADLLGIDATKPLIMIDGSRQPSGDGLTIAAAETDVTAIAVGNFPRFGIFLDATPADLIKGVSYIDRVYAGVDPAGNAAPNFRGIVHIAPWAVSVTSSVVSGNHASGIVIANGYGIIRDNRIGVAPGSDAPLPNGASGIYLSGRSEAAVESNVLAYNHDFGVGLDAFQRSVRISRNTMHDNGAGIDVGLDGPTPNAADDSHRQPNYPVIESAHYDETKKQTIIVLRIDTREAPPLLPQRNETFVKIEAEVYANSTPNAQAERLVASVGTSFTELTVTADGDLRGQWLTAITIRYRADCWSNCAQMYETSELSPPVFVP